MYSRAHQIMVGLAMASIILISMTMAVLPAKAEGLYPEDGWWWGLGPSGRGYFIERQEDIMFIVSMHYADAGEPEWLSAEGSLGASNEDGAIGAFSGQVYRSSNGQCIACEAVNPVTVESVQSPLTVSFSDNQHGTIVAALLSLYLLSPGGADAAQGRVAQDHAGLSTYQGILLFNGVGFTGVNMPAILMAQLKRKWNL
jgi:hypothetical protein